jgi:hypothetical protein
MTLAVGDAATEIARVAREREVDLIVMGLHSSETRPHHMGHVTYGVLCASPVVVLAWPPGRTPNTMKKGPENYVFGRLTGGTMPLAR